MGNLTSLDSRQNLMVEVVNYIEWVLTTGVSPAPVVRIALADQSVDVFTGTLTRLLIQRLPKEYTRGDSLDKPLRKHLEDQWGIRIEVSPSPVLSDAIQHTREAVTKPTTFFIERDRQYG